MTLTYAAASTLTIFCHGPGGGASAKKKLGKGGGPHPNTGPPSKIFNSEYF